jgi:hypothetical protein
MGLTASLLMIACPLTFADSVGRPAGATVNVGPTPPARGFTEFSVEAGARLLALVHAATRADLGWMDGSALAGGCIAVGRANGVETPPRARILWAARCVRSRMTSILSPIKRRDERCRHTRDHMSEYLDGELDPQTAAQVEHHARWRPNCHRMLANLKRTIAGLHLLRDEPAVDEPPED